MEKLSSVFFYQLEKAIKSYRQYAQSRLIAAGFSITIDQWLILKTITDQPDLTQKELAQAVFKDQASVTRILDLLVREKYLERLPNEANRRTNRLKVTRKGQSSILQVQKVVLKNRELALTGIAEKDLRAAEKVLNSIAQNCGKTSKI